MIPAVCPELAAVEEQTATDSLLLFYREKFDILERELAALQEQVCVDLAHADRAAWRQELDGRDAEIAAQRRRYAVLSELLGAREKVLECGARAPMSRRRFRRKRPGDARNLARPVARKFDSSAIAGPGWSRAGRWSRRAAASSVANRTRPARHPRLRALGRTWTVSTRRHARRVVTRSHDLLAKLRRLVEA